MVSPGAAKLWRKLRNPNCTECPLHESAETVCLIGDGPVPAKMMIVGEAPGYREDDIGKPFAGASGRYLDEVLESVGLDRKDIFISNAVKCHPPQNATPTRTQIKACKHYLDAEIAKVKPEFILTVGNVSMLSILGKSGIMQHRGEVNEYNGAATLSTVHPASVLRTPRNEAVFRSDVGIFSRLVQGLPAKTPGPKVYIVRTKKLLAQLCHDILMASAVAYDFETNAKKDWNPEAKVSTIAVCTEPGLVYVVPIDHVESRWKRPEDVLRAIGTALLYTNAKRVAHNAKFDDKWFIRLGLPVYAHFDTMLAAHILDENRYKGLKPLAQILLGVDPWKDVDLSRGQAMTVPLRKLARYNAKDADFTLRLYYLFKQQLEDQQRLARIFAYVTMPASGVLTDAERNGLWVDQQRLLERTAQVQKKLSKIRAKMVKMVGYEANWNSTQQLAVILFQRFKLPVIELTKGGAPSTKESVLLHLKDKHPFIPVLLEYRYWNGYLTRYFSAWAELMDKDGRLHANYKLHGTVTGRLSSGKEDRDRDRGLNMQQVPRDPFARSVLGAPPGYKFVEADFSQIEMRIAAHITQDPVLMRIYQMDQDVHMEMAMRLTNKPAADVSKEERKGAKGVNFGYLFGMWWRKFIEYMFDTYEIQVTEQEAQESRRIFFGTYKMLQPWHNRQRRLVRKHGYVESPIGRVRHLPDIYSHDEKVQQEAERQAINSPVQGLASDFMQIALAVLNDEMPPDEAKIVGTVHDSGLFEIRDDVVEKWARRIKQVMEDLLPEILLKKFGLRFSVPIKADVTVGQHWSEGEAFAA